MSDWCRHELCPIIEVHERHDEDFLGRKPRGRPPTGRKPKSKVELVRALQPTITRVEHRPEGPLAFTHCRACEGAGCDECNETGETSLYRWHLWKKR